jgi:hypothetical protein
MTNEEYQELAMLRPWKDAPPRPLSPAEKKVRAMWLRAHGEKLGWLLRDGREG